MSEQQRLFQIANLLDDLYAERQQLNEVIYHIRRYVLKTNYKKGHELIKRAKDMIERVEA